jgi:hypothetical protein
MFALGWAVRSRTTARPQESPPPSSEDLPPVDSIFSAPTGALAESQKAHLWELFKTLGAIWAFTNVSREELLMVVDLKTMTAPSYLAEYERAIDLYEVRRDTMGPTGTVQAMLKGSPLEKSACRALSLDPSDPEDRATIRLRIAHAREFVLAEFIRLYLSRGAFKQFGLSRYPGYLAGNEPYRTSPTQPRPQPPPLKP